MAFGFGFNKQKVLSAAEKFVQQGKLQNAIAEYEKILKADPKDLTVTNTVGDLYSRLGDADKAVECFKSVGDAYATQGFTVKAIAMYKKLSKSKPSIESVLRLAELYTQQGLFNDARAQYLQVAEEFLRAGELDQAVRIFQKTLEMDPENVAMRLRLADVYVRLGKKDEARQVYSAAAETLRAKGQLDAAEEVLQKLVKLDPGSSEAVLLRARNAMETGDYTSAAQQLEKIKGIETNPEAMRGLFHSYLHLGKLTEAGALAPKVFAAQSETNSIREYVDALTSAGQFEDALAQYQAYGDRLLQADSTKFLNGLHAMIGPLSESTVSLESILQLLGGAGDKSHDAEICELLAHASVQSGELEKARDYYAELIELEPQNALHAQSYQQVMNRLGGSSSGITAEEGAVLVDELETSAPFIEQTYDDGIALAVRAAITDADLFLSYNMPEKALTPLLSVLPQAPRDLRLNQKLAALHTRASRFAEAAVSCHTLESLYHDAGHPGEASRYAELASKYEVRALAGGSRSTVVETPVLDATPKVADFAVATDSVALVEEPAEFGVQPALANDAQEFQIEVSPAPMDEIDLSGEWDTGPAELPVAEVEPQPSAAPAAEDDIAVAETIEEIRFYLEHSMLDAAWSAVAKLKTLTSDEAMLSVMTAQVEAAAQAPVEESAAAIEPEAAVVTEEIAEIEVVAPPMEFQEITGTEHAVVASVEPPASQEASEEPPMEIAPAPAEETVAAASGAAENPITELVGDLEASLSEQFAAPVAEAEIGEPPAAEEPAAEEPAAKLPVVEIPVAMEPVTVEPAAAVVVPAAAIVPENVPELPIAAAAAPTGALDSLVSDLEAALPADFALGSPAPAPTAAVAAASHVVQAPTAAPIAMSAAASASASPVAIQPLPPQVVVPPAATKPDPIVGVDLADLFGELKQELEDDTTSADEDPETHYNLGVAFREMGLLDEAIGEFQKVCQSNDKGHAFSQMMQTYTWLAQCFLDKGVPDAAVRWYEQALHLPNLDGESKTALHYEIGSSYESAGNKAAALSNFMQAYGSNIDYRDVAERIRALKS